MATRTPSHRRQVLGIALRNAREQLELTQAEAARRIGKSQPWLAKIETAQIVRIKQSDLNSMLDAYNIFGARAEELRDFARTPYDKGGAWVDTSPSPAWWKEYQEIERQAKVIKAVHLEAHDGLIQTEAYMRRQFELGGVVNIEKQVQARLGRQDALFDQESTPDCTFLLSEACLHRHMGDRAMMVTQLEHLLALSKRPYITILLLPFDANFSASTYGFTFLQFNSALMADFVSIEYAVGSATIDDEDALRVFQRRWELIRSAALGEYDSRRFLRRVLTEYQELMKGS